MTSARRLFLRDVLGIRNWIQSDTGPVAPAQIRSVARNERIVPTVVIVRSPNWRADQNQLVDRILAAVHLNDSPVSQSVSETQAMNVVVFDSAAAIGKVVTDSQVLWNLGQLSAMQNGTPESIQAAKREVWTLLKTLKDEVGQ